MARACKLVLVLSEEPRKASYNRMVKVKRFGAEQARAATAARSLEGNSGASTDPVIWRKIVGGLLLQF